MNRRAFVQSAVAGLAAVSAGSLPALAARRRGSKAEPLFTISLAQWSLHRALQSKALDHLDFPKAAKETYGIDAVEYVNSFFAKKGDMAYVRELKQRCSDFGVTSVLIMCDGEGALGDADEAKRMKAVENHYKWADAAKELGCHSVRVNAQSSGTFEEQQDRAADGLHRLCEYTDKLGLYTIVENHWGLSSNGAWLAGVMKKVKHPRVGTLPDFGNFDPKEYDRYQGIQDMMPFAKGVSAKSHVFNDKGEESEIDYRKMMTIVLAAGYHGRVGVEFEGDKHSEPDGIRMTKALLEKIRDEMSLGK